MSSHERYLARLFLLMGVVLGLLLALSFLWAGRVIFG